MNWLADPFYARHRGPFILHLTRPHPRKGKAGFSTGEWLKGEIAHGEDVEAEALALLRDPRDTIVFVTVWSITESQAVHGYRKEGA